MLLNPSTYPPTHLPTYPPAHLPAYPPTVRRVYLEDLSLSKKARWTVAMCCVNVLSLWLLTAFTWHVETSAAMGGEGGGGCSSLGCGLFATALLFLLGFGAGYAFYIPQVGRRVVE